MIAEMTPLASCFRSHGFVFELLDRADDVALLRKSKPGFEFVTYEVVIVQSMGDHQWPDGNFTPAHEHLPGSEEWGVKGWTCSDLADARKKFREVRFVESLKKK